MEESLCSECEQNLVCPLAYVRLQECLDKCKLPEGGENDRYTTNANNY